MLGCVRRVAFCPADSQADKVNSQSELQSEFAGAGSDSECGRESTFPWNRRRAALDTVQRERPGSNRSRHCGTSNRVAASPDCMRPRPTSSTGPAPSSHPLLLSHSRNSGEALSTGVGRTLTDQAVMIIPIVVMQEAQQKWKTRLADGIRQ